MNLQKAQMKMEIAQDFGKKFEERETACIADMHRYDGAANALKQCVEKMASVKAFYQRECDDGRVEEAALADIYRIIDRCQGVAISLGDVAQAQKLMKQGEATEAKRSLDIIEKMYQDERARLESVLQNLENGEVQADPGSPTVRVIDGMTPGAAAADLMNRRAEARAAREAAKEAPGAPTEPAAETSTPVEPPATPAPEAALCEAPIAEDLVKYMKPKRSPAKRKGN